jgi:hypothetical protein
MFFAINSRHMEGSLRVLQSIEARAISLDVTKGLPAPRWAAGQCWLRMVRAEGRRGRGRELEHDGIDGHQPTDGRQVTPLCHAESDWQISRERRYDLSQAPNYQVQRRATAALARGRDSDRARIGAERPRHALYVSPVRCNAELGAGQSFRI